MLLVGAGAEDLVKLPLTVSNGLHDLDGITKYSLGAKRLQKGHTPKL